VVDAYGADRSRSLTFYSHKYGTTVETIKRHVPTRRIGSRLDLAPPGERHLFRGRITMLADVDGRPQIVRITPSNDAGWRAVQGHDAAVFGAVFQEQDGDLRSYRTRVVIDGPTGQRFRFYVDGEGIREAAYSGEFELQELFYEGHGRHNLDALLSMGGDE
jgi:hypothetical protein